MHSEVFALEAFLVEQTEVGGAFQEVPMDFHELPGGLRGFKGASGI